MARPIASALYLFGALSAGYTKPDPALLRCRQGGLSALAGEPCFQLGDGGHLRQDELAHRAAHLGQVSKEHVDTALDQRQQEACIARQAIELGDDELGLVLLAGGERLLQLGPPRPAAALDLGVFADQLPRSAVEPGAHAPRGRAPSDFACRSTPGSRPQTGPLDDAGRRAKANKGPVRCVLTRKC